MIKILKDICVLQPQFPRTNEICVKIMRRIGDEEGIKVRGGEGSVDVACGRWSPSCACEGLSLSP